MEADFAWTGPMVERWTGSEDARMRNHSVFRAGSAADDWSALLARLDAACFCELGKIAALKS